MTEGTSQGLFIVVAIIIFGIFVALSNNIFGSQLTPSIQDLFSQASDQAYAQLTDEELRDKDNILDLDPNLLIDWEDENLKEAVADELGTKFGVEVNKYSDGSSQVSVGNLLEADNLNVSNNEIYDLTGLEYAVNLESLNASDNNISSIEPIRDLPKLTELDLSGNEVDDIRPFTSIQTLETLYLENNYIEDVTGITQFSNLDYLDLKRNPLSDNSLEMIGSVNNIAEIIVDTPYPIADVTPTPQGLFEYLINDDNTSVTLVNYIGDEIDVVIPHEVQIDGNTYSVTHIGDYAFNTRTGLSIPNVINIQLDSVVIPNSVKVIGTHAFYGNEFGARLENLVLGNGVVEIHERAFWNIRVEKLDIPDSVRYIGDSAFSVSRGFTFSELTLGRNIEYIGRNAFSSNRLTEIKIPDSVKEIGMSAFSPSGSHLEKLDLGNGVEHIGTRAFQDNLLEDLHLPESLTRIDNLAFTSDTLERVYLGDVNNFNQNDLWGSFSAKVNLYPEQPYRFDMDTGTITGYWGSDEILNIPSELYDVAVVTIGSYAFNMIQNNNNHVRADLKEVIIPDTVKTIESYAFNSNSNSSRISKLTLGNNVEEIGLRAFTRHALTSVTIPDSVTSLGSHAFEGSANDPTLEELHIGSGLSIIPLYGFANSNLVSVTIPSNIRTIRNRAFENSSQLSNLNLNEGLESIGVNSFANNDIRELVLPNSLQTMDTEAFVNNNNLHSITFGDSLERIGIRAFRFNSLTEVHVRNGVSIGGSAFANSSQGTVEVIRY